MASSLRILMITNHYPPFALGGAEWVAHDIVEELSRRGHLFRVVTSGDAPPASDPGHVNRVLRLHGAPPSGMPGRARHLLFEEYYDARNARILSEEIRRFRPDRIYLNAPTGLSHAILWAAGRSGVSLLIHLHDYWLRDALSHRRLGRVNRRLFAHGLKSPWRIVAVSERLRALHVAAGIPPDRIETIRNGIRAATPPDGPRLDRALFCGRATRAKGLHVAAEAGFAIDVLGSGDEAYAGDCRTLSGEAMRFLDRVPRAEVISVMGRYPVLVLPSLWEEPCPLVILEAMGAGCVPVASRIGGIPELLEPEPGLPCGLLVPPGDAKALAEAVNQLMEDEALRVRLARNGTVALEKHFSLERMMDGIEKSLQAVP